ncbi:MAG: alpha/beta fold hydrolase, partial [Thiobacillus sp.]|nr:alpha/beta fold hydrolase [Thiobacillus sp.]
MPSSEPVLVLLHGWGMHAGLFDGLRAALADDFDVRACTLPGHGGRALLADNSLAAWADDFASQLPDGATVLGWSLGGQVALRAALDHPHKIARLALLASTPRFVAAPDWPHAMAADDLDAFAGALA